jgi:hypothetical protein
MWKPTPEQIEEHNAVMEREVEPEWLDWYRMTPMERWAAQEQMWATFFFLGGSLDDDDETGLWTLLPSYRRSGI